MNFIRKVRWFGKTFSRSVCIFKTTKSIIYSFSDNTAYLAIFFQSNASKSEGGSKFTKNRRIMMHFVHLFESWLLYRLNHKLKFQA